ncbi:MAG: hypothetical protein HRT72_13780, partial [Flavobacteriales bacterium]|nr:hypothetical protein [Flavobacteriales bacterium]
MGVIFLCILFSKTSSGQAVFTSISNGNWSDNSSTWMLSSGNDEDGTPDINDSVTISANDTISLENGSCENLTVNGFLSTYNSNTLNINQNLIINGAGKIDRQNGSSGTATINVSGTFTTTGSDTTKLGRINLNVTGNSFVQNILCLSSGGGTKSLNGNLTVNSSSEILGKSSTTLTVGSNCILSGSLTQSSDIATLLINGDLIINESSFPDIGKFHLTVLGQTLINGTLSFSSTEGSKSLNDIILSSTGIWKNNNVNEDFTITGSINNNGGIWLACSGINCDYTLTGIGKTLEGGPIEFVHFICNGTITNNANLTISQKLTGSGTFINGANDTLNYKGSTITVNNLDASTPGNTVDIEYTSNSDIPIPNLSTYHHLIISGTGDKTMIGNLIINGDLNINVGSLDTDEYQIIGNATGKLSLAANVDLNLGKTDGSTMVSFPTGYTSANIIIDSTSTIRYQANTSQSISILPTYGNLILSTGATASTKSISGTLNILTDLQINSEVTFNQDNNNVNVARDIVNSGEIFITTGALDVNRDYKGIGNLSFTGAGNMNIADDWTNSGIFSSGTSTVTYNGSVDQTIAAASYYNLIGDNYYPTSNLELSAGMTTVNGDLTITGGRLRAGSSPDSLTVIGTTRINSNGEMRFSNSSGVYMLGSTILTGGTIGGGASGEFNCTSLLISSGTSGVIDRVKLNNTGTTTVNGSLDWSSTSGTKILNDIIISSSGSWTSSAGESFSIGGSFTLHNGLFTTGTGDYTFTGSNKTINSSSGSLTFGDKMIFDGSYTNNVTTLTINGDLNGSGIFANASNKTIRIGDDVAPTLTFNATAIANTVEYNGTTDQSAGEGNFYNLV